MAGYDSEMAGISGPMADFDLAFPNLSLLMKDESFKTWREIELEIQRRAARAAPEVTLFGTRVRAGRVAFWGLTVVTSVLLYLLAHQLQLLRLGDFHEAAVVPWLGLYQGYFSRVLTVVMLVGAPCTTLVLLERAVVRETIPLAGQIVSMGCFAASLVLVVALMLNQVTIWKRLSKRR